MKKGRLFILLIALICVYSSCKPIYKCGESRTKLHVSKRFEAVINERDKLCKTLKIKEDEIVNLKNNIKTLNSSIDAWEKKYNEMSRESLSKAEQYNIALKQKTDELNAKEKLLQERENAIRELQRAIERQDSITKALNESIRNALLGFQSDELSVEIKDGKVYVLMSDKLLFKSGSATVEPKGAEALKVLADVLNKNTNVDILIEGHTDNVPIRTAVFKDNWDLSVVRATSIVRILTDVHKIAPTRLTASGKGEFYPRASNSTAEGRASNRRTEIILSPKLEEILKLLKTD